MNSTFKTASQNVWSVASRSLFHSCSSSPDYSVFATPDFNPNEYANAILAGEPYPDQKYTKLSTQDPVAKEDISVAISKLTSGIDDVAKQIKQLVRL